MNELALLAGVGGSILGTHQLGLNTVCAVERNEHRRCVLMQRQNEGHLPPFPIWDDVCTFTGRSWMGTVDIISGGFPCQAFSTAARGRNNAEDLWPYMARIIQEAMSTYVFAENVSYRAIDVAAKQLCAMGYKVQCTSISADELGACHVRERFWLLAYADDKSQLQRTVNAKMAELSEFRGSVWEAKPPESRMDDGLSRRVDRYESCGNGQVPVVAATALWTLANS